MTIHAVCSRCLQELDQPGAVVLSPPRVTETDPVWGMVLKRHLCVECYEHLQPYILGERLG